MADGEAEAQCAVVGIERDRRLHAQAREDPGDLLALAGDSRDIGDLPRQPRGELLLRGRYPQVERGYEGSLLHEPLLDPVDERGLAVAPRSEQHHVLTVQRIGRELGKLVLTVGERVIERDRPVREWVRCSYTDKDSLNYPLDGYLRKDKSRWRCPQISIEHLVWLAIHVLRARVLEVEPEPVEITGSDQLRHRVVLGGDLVARDRLRAGDADDPGRIRQRRNIEPWLRSPVERARDVAC